MSRALACGAASASAAGMARSSSATSATSRRLPHQGHGPLFIGLNKWREVSAGNFLAPHSTLREPSLDLTEERSAPIGALKERSAPIGAPSELKGRGGAAAVTPWERLLHAASPCSAEPADPAAIAAQMRCFGRCGPADGSGIRLRPSE
eukprot:CAMPEP_0195068536 /NCGR_PEP_ID=MMETSP0448-20130528/13213_1 /TAXON_ID=66468 /ORGANISM="Heterocapsa triquestra, Strain CCMP 448" /LENGTH=148 /DNA_ID=CAMNT_0040100069 /DNA_START=331 /DNA_END=774 /DNA_ORIENTATION=+